MQQQNEKLGRKLNRLLNHCDLQNEQMNVVLIKLKKMEHESAEVRALYSTLIRKENNNYDELINVRYHLGRTLEKDAFPKPEASNSDLERRLGESEFQRKELQQKLDLSESQKKELLEELERIEAEMKELQEKDDQSELELQEAYQGFINVCICLQQFISVGVLSFFILFYQNTRGLHYMNSKVGCLKGITYNTLFTISI